MREARSKGARVRHASAGLSESAVISSCSTSCTTFMPSTTLPKTTCLPSSQPVVTVVMKNWEPFVFGPLFAMLRTPLIFLGKEEEKRQREIKQKR